jgi:hypothetical protein
VLSENSPSCRAKKGLSGSPHEPRNTAWHAISIHKLGLYPLNWLWRPPRAAELLGAACGGLLALISLREIKPSSPGLDPSNALRSCATHGQLDPTPWGPRALDPPVGSAGEGAPTEEPRPNIQRPKEATRDHAKPFGRARVRASRVCSFLPRASSFAGAYKLNRYGVDTLPPYLGSVIVPWVCLYTGPKAGFGSSDEWRRCAFV